MCLNDGSRATIEIKLVSKEMEDVAKHLCVRRDKVNTKKIHVYRISAFALKIIFKSQLPSCM